MIKAQLQALLTQAGIDPNTPLTIEQIDPNQQQQVATLCTSPGGTQYTVLTQSAVQQQGQQQYILQTTPINEPSPPQLIAPKEELSSPPKRRAFAVKSTLPTTETFEEIDSNERPRRKIFATKSSVTPLGKSNTQRSSDVNLIDLEHDEEEEEEEEEEEGIIGTRAYHRK